MVFLEREVHTAPDPVPGVVAQQDVGADLSMIISRFKSEVAGDGVPERQVDVECVFDKSRENHRTEWSRRLAHLVIVVVIKHRQRGGNARGQVVLALDACAERTTCWVST